jgi:putative ABC transport system substrate-binding protein
MAVASMAPAIGRAQQPGKLARIGIFDLGLPLHFAAFFAGMRALGYVEGQNVDYVRRSAAGGTDLVAQMAAALVESKVDVIVTTGPLPTVAVMKATSTIPVVFVLGDPIATGVVSNLARPDRNATGLSFLNTEVGAKRLELLVEMLPGTHRVAILFDRNSTRANLDSAVAAARALDLEASVTEIGAAGELESAYAAAAAARVQAIDVLASPFFNANRARLVDLAANYRLPAMYESDEFVRSGGLISYGAGIVDLFRRMAGYVDKILKGAKPADLPVQQPTKIDLTVNMKTAKALGLAIPPALIARADEVIE